MSALDQPGKVGHHEAPLSIEIDNAQVGLEGSERIGGDPRSGPRDASEQRRLAGVGWSHQPNIGDQLELELESPLLARLTGIRIPGRLTRRRGKLGVPTAAAPTFRGQPPRPGLHEIGQDLAGLGILDHRPGRNFDLEVLPVPPATTIPGARATAAGTVPGLFTAVEQCANGTIDDQRHAPPATSIATVRSPFGHVLLASKTDAARAAAAGEDLDLGVIDQHDLQSPAAEVRRRVAASRPPKRTSPISSASRSWCSAYCAPRVRLRTTSGFPASRTSGRSGISNSSPA